jgi:hypothetical protein
MNLTEHEAIGILQRRIRQSVLYVDEQDIKVSFQKLNLFAK